MVSLLPSSFWPFTSCLYLRQQWLNITCIWYSEPQHRIFDLFDLLSIISLHHPSTHHLLAFHLLLVFDSASLNLFLIYLIYSLSSLSLSLPRFGTLFACCQFMLWLLLSFFIWTGPSQNLPGLFNSTQSLLVWLLQSSFHQDKKVLYLNCFTLS